MSNLPANNQQLIESASIVITVPGQEPIEDLLVGAITVTSDAGTENQTTPFRVAGYFNTAGGFSLSYTSNQPVDLSGPNYEQLSDRKTEFALDIFDIRVVDGAATPIASRRYNTCRVVTNTTHDAPKSFEVTITATSRDERVELVQTA